MLPAGSHHQQRAEILIIGNEILNGTTLDTNSWWLSRQLSSVGVRVERKLTIGDELESISSSFKQCISRNPDWIFSIGGLGPTFDDITLQALSRALGKQWKLSKDAAKMLEDNYARRAKRLNLPRRRLTKARLKMARLPSGAVPLSNPVGSAPGVLASARRSHIVSLPGVPSEMKGIFLNEIRPSLKSNFFSSEEWIKVVGVSESELAPAVSSIFRKYGATLYIKSHPSGFERGKPVIKLQIILNTINEEKKLALESLRSAATSIELAARKLGARSKKIKSVRRFRAWPE
jgi:nicotinamide-nucleotide amidase